MTRFHPLSILLSVMNSYTKIPNGNQVPLIVNLEPAPNNETLLATLVKNVETLTHKINTAPPQLSPLRSHTSPLLEGTFDNRSAHQSTSRQSRAKKWQAALHEQMKGKVEQIRLLEKKLEKVESSKVNDSSLPLHIGSSPFTLKVLTCPLPSHFRPLVINLFDDSKDPCDHLEIFYLHMHVQSYEDLILCPAFSLTLKGLAQ
ncbi:hypothetical protein CJ030_MR1G016847 [Morella rubra]|uniref:Uncharacterized protein n=1 Tax=Morella rubra TaxID=262757 RepID=A0A6A1WPP8_9ROSI|nr:hypothetical protein CJ030_MR1G016847 [Morella rubra]